jgi:glycosyltransferase involved in cell wall biosynthesis
MPETMKLPTAVTETQDTADPATAARLRRVLYAIAMDPDRFATMEEQILLITRAFRQRAGLFLPLFICSHRKGNPAVYEAAGLRAECLDLHRFRLHTLWQLVRLIRRDRIELIHWNFTEPLLNKYLWALTLLTPGVKHYFTDHTSRGLPLGPPAQGIRRVIKKIMFARYNTVFGVSQFVINHLRDQGCATTMIVRPYFLNTDRFRPDPEVRAALRKELGVTGQFVVVVVAYLVQTKGVDIAIRAVASLPETTTLWIVGGGVESDRLRKLSRDLGVDKRVHFFGHQADVQRFLKGADCFVCPSRWGEAAGVVNLEAQATGLPALVSRIGGIPEYIQDGKTGFLFTPEDSQELATKLLKLSEDPELLRRVQNAARAWVLADFSHERKIEEFLNMYRRS